MLKNIWGRCVKIIEFNKVFIDTAFMYLIEFRGFPKNRGAFFYANTINKNQPRQMTIDK
jgi:hypothetical protein